MSILLCEIQRSTGDNGRMREIRVVTPHVRPLYGTTCGDATLFELEERMIKRWQTTRN